MATTVLAATMTEREFGMVFTKLANQLRATDVDLATLKSYYESLADLPLASIDTAALAWSRVPGQKWFPTTGEWRDKAQAASAEALRKALPHREQPWRYSCEACEDTGWVMDMTCDGGGETWPEDAPPNTTGKTPWCYRAQQRETATPGPIRCDRQNVHLPHTYTQACSCRETNQTYQRKKGGAA